MMHAPREEKIEEAKDNWMRARERLAKDPNAEIDDLVGAPAFQYEADKHL
jgi:hypothetical protein